LDLERNRLERTAFDIVVFIPDRLKRQRLHARFGEAYRQSEGLNL
jgi:hypothetical protein